VKRGRVLLGAAITILALGVPRPAGADATVFRLPLNNYPLNDNCLGWGVPNPNFQRCGAPGLHVADDACAPNATLVYGVADGVFRFGEEVGSCTDNWGWVTVVEHTLPGGEKICSIYGHCQPVPDLDPGDPVTFGMVIAAINNACIPHIHFAIYRGPFGAANGVYPPWLLGYLPGSGVCAQYPTLFPGNYVDPVQFVNEHVPVERSTWGKIKLPNGDW
jgi:hypothetical protein